MLSSTDDDLCWLSHYRVLSSTDAITMTIHSALDDEVKTFSISNNEKKTAASSYSLCAEGHCDFLLATNNYYPPTDLAMSIPFPTKNIPQSQN